MFDDTLSIAAAVLTTEFVRRNELDDSEAVRLWRKIRKRMITADARERDTPGRAPKITVVAADQQSRGSAPNGPSRRKP